jgi:hypothetical protein
MASAIQECILLQPSLISRPLFTSDIVFDESQHTIDAAITVPAFSDTFLSLSSSRGSALYYTYLYFAPDSVLSESPSTLAPRCSKHDSLLIRPVAQSPD